MRELGSGGAKALAFSRPNCGTAFATPKHKY